MQPEPKAIQFEQLVREADSVFAEAERGERVIVEYHGRPYQLTPVRRTRRQRRRLAPDDPFLDLIGMGNSNGPGDVSLHVDDYLAQAYTAEGE